MRRCSRRPRPAPQPCCACRTPLPRAQRARIAFSAHVPCLLSCGRSARSPVHMARRLWQRVGGRAGVASYHPLSKSFNGGARRRPQAAAQRVAARYAKRERTTKDFGIDLFNSDERPTLRPEALLSMSLCLLVQRSSGCAQLSMCVSCQRC